MTLPQPPAIYPAQGWMADAACKGVPLAPFFSDVRAEQNEAKKVCGSCTVRRACLDYAIVTNSVGVYGGMTHRERRRLLSDGYWPGRGADPFRASRVQA